MGEMLGCSERCDDRHGVEGAWETKERWAKDDGGSLEQVPARRAPSGNVDGERGQSPADGPC